MVRGGDGEELGKGGGCQGDRRRRHREVVSEKQEVRAGDGEELGKGEWRELREGAGGDGEEKHELRGGEVGKRQEGGDEGINHVTTL